MNKFWEDLRTNKVHNQVVNAVNLWNTVYEFRLDDIKVKLDFERDKECEGWEFFLRPSAKDYEKVYDIYLETVVFVPMDLISDGESLDEAKLFELIFSEMPTRLDIKERK